MPKNPFPLVVVSYQKRTEYKSITTSISRTKKRHVRYKFTMDERQQQKMNGTKTSEIWHSLIRNVFVNTQNGSKLVIRILCATIEPNNYKL